MNLIESSKISCVSGVEAVKLLHNQLYEERDGMREGFELSDVMVLLCPAAPTPVLRFIESKGPWLLSIDPYSNPNLEVKVKALSIA
jgi:hypothetical protein